VERPDAGPTDILAVAGRIAMIGRDASGSAPSGTEHVDAGGLLAAPGLIDLQINGAVGHDVTADPASLWAVAEALPRFGTTAFLPTLVSADADTIDAARAVLRAGPPYGHQGAIPLGLHVEGPFLNGAKRGAHPLASLRRPDPELARDWSPANGIRMVTLAPELQGALDLVSLLVSQGVVVSAGHSAATLEQARTGFDAGIRAVTHLFNAMPPLDHKAPGLVGAALADERVTIGLIADGVHVDPNLVGLVWRLVGRGRLALVTDAIAALGMAPGRYRLGDMDVITDGTAARIGDVLAGSLLSHDQAIRNLMAFSGCTAAEALDAATAVPARLLGDADRGSLEPGRRADIVLFTHELGVAATIIGGTMVHAATRVSAR
jgi:N-acetylglucosamine-6-phosphate deacetylase